MKSFLLVLIPAILFFLITHAKGESETPKQEETSQVGPEKGILSANERDGFKLSPEAEAKFEIKRVEISRIPFSISVSSIVRSLQEQNLFRYREGFYKRISFITLTRVGNNLTIQSKDLKAGDQIVTLGISFLRIAEISAFGGTPDEH